jgi:hypothetical protein
LKNKNTSNFQDLSEMIEFNEDEYSKNEKSRKISYNKAIKETLNSAEKSSQKDNNNVTDSFHISTNINTNNYNKLLNPKFVKPFKYKKVKYLPLDFCCNTIFIESDSDLRSGNVSVLKRQQQPVLLNVLNYFYEFKIRVSLDFLLKGLTDKVLFNQDNINKYDSMASLKLLNILNNGSQNESGNVSKNDGFTIFSFNLEGYFKLILNSFYSSGVEELKNKFIKEYGLEGEIIKSSIDFNEKSTQAKILSPKNSKYLNINKKKSFAIKHIEYSTETSPIKFLKNIMNSYSLSLKHKNFIFSDSNFQST